MKKIGILLLAAVLSLCGCGKDSDKKLQDLEFTVVADREVPEELAAAINEKKEEPFKLTYSTEEYLYIVTGYGTQSTGGYSIQVLALYLTESNIVLDTELLGPSDQSGAGTETSYPYIVLKIELREEPVAFQ